MLVDQKVLKSRNNESYLSLLGYQSGAFEASMSSDFEPVLEAATSMIVKTGYTLLFVLAAMLTIHVFGAVLFHFLRTRRKFPVHRVYISSAPPGGPGGVTLHPQNHPRHPKDSDDTDSDDNDGFKTYTSGRQGVRHPAGAPDQTLLHQYSETKV